jgi:hypothetical protein
MSSLFLLPSNSSGRAFSGAGVGLGALAPHRKSLAMTQSPVTAKVHESFFFHRNVTPQITFNLDVLVDVIPDLGYFCLGQLIRPGVAVYTCFDKYLLGGRSSNAKDIGQSDLNPFIPW